MRLKTLRKAKPEAVLRLANWYHLHIDGMSYRQILKLVKWRVTRNGMNRH
jgi:hypothetical protein